MPLTPGSKLGPYEVVNAIGADGMGEVYKARDTRLDRIVALKVIQTHVAATPEFRERFDREARAISALQCREEQGVDNGEHGGDGTNANAENEHCYCRESWRALQAAGS